MCAEGKVFIKLSRFLMDLWLIPITYRNGQDTKPYYFHELSFHVAKHGDGRGGEHIHIVYGITLLAKLRLQKSARYLYL